MTDPDSLQPFNFVRLGIYRDHFEIVLLVDSQYLVAVFRSILRCADNGEAFAAEKLFNLFLRCHDVLLASKCSCRNSPVTPATTAHAVIGG